MKVSALVHFAYPWRAAGSETVLLELLRAAARAGHDVTCFVTNRDALRSWSGHEPVEKHDGITLIRVRNPIMAGKQLHRIKPDVLVTHHQHATYAIKLAKVLKARSVFATHNDFDINQRPLLGKPDLVIHNSHWVQDSLHRFGEQKQEFVFHPPLTADRHKVESTGDALTLCNVNKDKGSIQFYELAKRMPDRKFIGVIGGHGEQIIRRNIPNVEILEHGPDMTRVWSRTRILLMPSIAESYGLTAVEAGINGIPTIASPTPGLRENLGRDGLFADRDDLTAWERQIKKLDNPDTYTDASTYALGRAEEALATTRRSLKEWVDWIG